MKKLIFMALLLFVASFSFAQNITEKYSEPLLKTDTGIIPIKVGNKWKKMSDSDIRFNPLRTSFGNLAGKDSTFQIHGLQINTDSSIVILKNSYLKKTQSGLVTLPNAFTSNVPFVISKTSNGFNTSVDDIEIFRDSFKIDYVSNYYYVAKTGSDSNNGLSEITPFLTLKKAIQVGNATNKAYEITINEGTYDYAECAFNTVYPTSPISIIGKGEVILHSGENDLSFVKTSGYDYVYQSYVAPSLFFMVLDKLEKDEFDAFLKLTKYTSLNDLKKSKKGYAYINDTLYIQNRKGSFSNDDFLILYSVQNRMARPEARRIYFENINLYGNTLIDTDTSILRNVSMHYSSSNNIISLTNKSLSVFYSCYFSKNNNGDVLNYTNIHGAYEINCQVNGSDCVNNTTSQASSTHDNTYSIRINGRYRGQDQSVTDVTNSISVLLGCDLATNYDALVTNTTNTYFTNLQARTGAKLWTWGVSFGGYKWNGNTSYELVTDDESIIYIKEMYSDKILLNSDIRVW